MRKFTKNERAGFQYTAAHWCAYQMTALNLKVWRPKFLLHDVEKPFLLLLAKALRKADPYIWAQQIHRKHSAHHIEYYREATLTKGRRNINTLELILDWECSRFTKETSPRTAYEEYQSKKESLPAVVCLDIETVLKEIGLWEESSGEIIND